MLQGVDKLIILAMSVSLITTLLFYADDRFLKRKMKYRTRQILFGLVFGALAVMGTEFGVNISGAVMNVRDAAPLCAGLFFGAPAGIIAGVIGGVERWFAVLWGAGAFTRVACSISTIISGLIGAFAKKYLLENKLPGTIYALLLGTVAEIFHMLMLYITNSDQAQMAHQIMMLCAPVMVPMVAIATAIPAIIILVIRSQGKFKMQNTRGIAQLVSAGLLVSVLLAFVATNVFEIYLQNKLCYNKASSMIDQTLCDVSNELHSAAFRNMDLEAYMKYGVSNKHIGTTGFIVIANMNGIVVSYTSEKYELPSRNISGVLPEIKKWKDGATYDIVIGDTEYFSGMKQYHGYYIIALYPKAEAEFNKSVSITLTAFLEVVILAVVFMMIYLLIRKVVVKNLNQINHDLGKITKGSLDTTVDVRNSTEFASLSDDINSTVDTLKRYIDKAAAKVDQELKVARNIQNSVLPKVFPDDNRFELYANMLAAKDVGGDFYDFYPVGDNRYAILVADVSGKGIPAAMFMMNAKSVIKSIVETGASPGVVFTKANEKLCANNEAEMFITAWLGIFNMDTGHIVYANAGHNPPVIKHPDGTLEFLHTRPGFVLAGMEGIKYADFDLDFEEGQSLFLYTDGITEATNENNELFGEDRLIKALQESGNLNMRYTCKYVKAEVDAFVDTAPQFDDITMLAFKRKSDKDRVGALVTDASEESADKVRSFFDEFIENNDISFKTSTKVMVIMDEIYSNIFNYSGASIAVVTAELEGNRIMMSFQDNGIPYNPLEKEDPDVTLSAEERKIGGLGIYMVKEMATDVKYSRIAGKNILDIVLEVE